MTQLGWAQGIFEYLQDSEAKTFASLLLATQKEKPGQVEALVRQSPGLSRRAFAVSVVESARLAERTPEQAEEFVDLAIWLAGALNRNFADPEPTAILDDIAAGRETDERLLDYWNRHRKEKRPIVNDNEYEDRYWESPAFPPDLDDKTRAIMRPLLAKGLRIEFASLVSSPTLLIREIDSYETVAKTVEKQFRDQGDTQALDASSYLLGLEITKLGLQADLGLLDGFEQSIQKLEKSEVEAPTIASLWLSAYHSSARQYRWDLAAESLRKSQDALGAGTGEPVLRYALATADYELRCARGFQPTPEQTLSEFRSAWSKLQNYQPKTLIGDDFDWPAGRLATKFWIDEFSGLPTVKPQALEQLWRSFQAWVMAVDSQGLELPGESLLWHQDEFSGDKAYFLALLDGFTYLLENSPEESNSEGSLLTLVPGLHQLVDVLASQAELDLFRVEGQPPFRLDQGGLIPELRSRLFYLESLAQGTPSARRVELMKKAQHEIGLTENPGVTVDYLLKFGQRFSDLGRRPEALECWTQALETARKYTYVGDAAKAAGLLAQEYQQAGEWEKAGHHAELAKSLLQPQLPALGARSSSGQKAALQAWQATSVETRAAIEQKAPEKAWEALAQGQQLQVSTLQMESEKPAQSQVRRSLEQERGVSKVAEEVDRLKAMPASPTRDELLQQGEKLLADNRAKFLSESRALRQKYSDLYSRVLRVDPLNLVEVQQSLPDDLVVLQYFPTHNALYIFLVSKTAFRLQQVDLGQEALDREILEFLRGLRRASKGDQELAKSSRSLYQKLIGPVEQDLKEHRTLLFIPSGRLNSLPFASLEDSQGAPLASSKRLLTLAKATDLTRLAKQGEKLESVVAFANATGDLPAATLEGQQISKMFPQAQLFTGKEATKSAFMQAGPQGQILHLATHGEWNLQDSLQNYLALANGEKVSQDEIFALDLSQKSLVMLSACNTAMGEGQDLNYVASLAEAFWIAGSRSVVASLWAVNDESTSLLMTEFYKALRAGDDKAEALRKAQMAVRADPKFAHPYYWAGFVLFGDWR